MILMAIRDCFGCAMHIVVNVCAFYYMLFFFLSIRKGCARRCGNHPARVGISSSLALFAGNFFHPSYQRNICVYPSSLLSQSMKTFPHTCVLLLCAVSAIATPQHQAPIQLPLSASSPSFETFAPVQRYDGDQIWRVKLGGEDIRRIEDIVDLVEVRTTLLVLYVNRHLSLVRSDIVCRIFNLTYGEQHHIPWIYASTNSRRTSFKSVYTPTHCSNLLSPMSSHSSILRLFLTTQTSSIPPLKLMPIDLWKMASLYKYQRRKRSPRLIRSI